MNQIAELLQRESNYTLNIVLCAKLASYIEVLGARSVLSSYDWLFDEAWIERVIDQVATLIEERNDAGN